MPHVNYNIKRKTPAKVLFSYDPWKNQNWWMKWWIAPHWYYTILLLFSKKHFNEQKFLGFSLLYRTTISALHMWHFFSTLVLLFCAEMFLFCIAELVLKRTKESCIWLCITLSQTIRFSGELLDLLLSIWWTTSKLSNLLPNFFSATNLCSATYPCLLESGCVGKNIYL